MTDRPKLYGYGASTYTRMARLAFAEKAVDYDYITVASWDGYHKDPAFADLHPFRKVPVLDHAGFRLFETLAICFYIDSAFGGLSLQPDAPLERARMMQLVSIVINYAWPVWVPVLTTERFFRQFEDKPTREDRIADALPIARHAAEVIDQILEHRSSGCFDLSDIFLAGSFSYVAEGPEGDFLLRGNDALSRWWSTTRDRKTVAEIMTKTDWTRRLAERGEIGTPISQSTSIK